MWALDGAVARLGAWFAPPCLIRGEVVLRVLARGVVWVEGELEGRCWWGETREDGWLGRGRGRVQMSFVGSLARIAG